MSVLVTKRLMLSPVTGRPSLELVKLQTQWLNDPHVTKFSEQRHRLHSIKSQMDYIDSFVWPDLLFSVTLNGLPIGTISAHTDIPNRVADIGILLGDMTQWGHGYGTEAWIAVMDHLFNMGIRKVTGGCMDANKAMINIFQKAGMREEARRKDQFILRGKPDSEFVDAVYWAKFKP